MKIHAIRNDSIALFTDIRELNSRGIDETSLAGEAATELIRHSFSQLGIACCGSIHVDTYINGAAVLIFARITKPYTVRALYSFCDLEHLICACHALTEIPDATLIGYDGEYYLAIHGDDTQSDADTLSEYGEIQPCTQLRYALITEHGTTICHGNAVAVICEKVHSDHSKNSFFADSLHSWE